MSLGPLSILSAQPPYFGTSPCPPPPAKDVHQPLSGIFGHLLSWTPPEMFNPPPKLSKVLVLMLYFCLIWIRKVLGIWFFSCFQWSNLPELKISIWNYYEKEENLELTHFWLANNKDLLPADGDSNPIIYCLFFGCGTCPSCTGPSKAMGHCTGGQIYQRLMFLVPEHICFRYPFHFRKPIRI